MRIERIVFTGDFFRTSDFRDPNQLANVFRLHGLLSKALAKATGIQPIVWFGQEYPQDTYEGPGASVPDDYFRAMYRVPNLYTWVDTFFKEPTDTLLELLAPVFDRSLVVSFEISPLLQLALDRLGVPWIDLLWSPIRFLPDLAFSFRGSSHFDLSRCADYWLKQDLLDQAVERIRDYYGKSCCHPEGGLVFFAQTNVDRTLLTPQGLYAIEDAVAGVQERLEGRKLWIKPHPLQLDNPILSLLRDRVGGELIADPTYGLLASEAPFEVVTISSSVAHEARLFGKRATTFNSHFLDHVYDGPMSLNGCCAPSFWARLLQPILPVQETGEAEPPAAVVPNLLRNKVGYYGLDRSVWEDERPADVDNLTKLMSQAEALLGLGQVDGAESMVQERLEQGVEAERLCLSVALGNIRLQKADPSQALDYFLRLVLEFPAEPIVYVNLCGAFVCCGQGDSASAWLQIAQRRFPEDPDLAQLAQVLPELISQAQTGERVFWMDKYNAWEQSTRTHAGQAFATRTLRRIEAYLPEQVESSAETGCGKSTIMFSNLSKRHKVFALDDRCLAGQSSVLFFQDCPISRPERVEFIYGPTQRTLPSYTGHDSYDVILLDGPHGYPFPELEYLCLFPHLKKGGLLIVDDVQIPTIGRMADFLAEDEMFEPLALIEGTAIFRRTEAQTFDPCGDGWWKQRYNRRRISPRHEYFLKDGPVADYFSPRKLDEKLHP